MARSGVAGGTDRPWLAVYDRIGVDRPDFDDRTLAEHIAEHARIRPGNPALLYPGRTVSYAEYDALASQFANALKALGVGKGDVVGLHMPNIPQYPIALAAISRLGAIGTGVSPLLTPPEALGQLRDCRASVLVSVDLLAPVVQALPADQLPALDAVIMTGPADLVTGIGGAAAPHPDIATYQFLSLLEAQPAQCPQTPVDWHETFMIQYTGGTTGQPKGAQLSVRNLMHNPRQYTAADDIEIGAEVVASAFPLFHVGGLSQPLFAAIAGGCITLAPDPRDIDQFCALMRAMPPTRIAAVPALYEMLLASESFQALDFSGLKVAATGAAPMPTATAERIARTVGEGKLTDVFGMTETSPCYTFHPPRARKPGSVGFAVPGADIRIVDIETGRIEQPTGEPGEIICSGPQVMKGYLNLPEESAHALREMDGETWMYSGDVGYMDEEGYVFLCDRAKDMLIVGGYKVFSVEIEDKLKAMPLIAASAVVGRPDPDRAGNDIVVLFVELTEAARALEAVSVKAEILDFCRTNFAAYKTPKDIRLVDAIPLTPIGKTDKKRLRAELA